jgi:hypothetical protein
VALRRMLVIAVGVAAVLVAAGLGAASCLRSLEPTRSAPTSASQITVTPNPEATTTGASTP